MTMKNGLRAALVAVLGIALAAPVAHVARADDISTVEGARAKERQGRHLNRMDREQLRRHGGNDDGYRYRGTIMGPLTAPASASTSVRDPITGRTGTDALRSSRLLSGAT